MLRHWELHVHFKVHGSGKDLFGDGFAIWYTRDRLELGKFRCFYANLPVFVTFVRAFIRNEILQFAYWRCE